MSEYNSLEEKKNSFNLHNIDTIQELTKFIDFATNNSQYAYRGINEAKYSLYSSLQRKIYDNDIRKITHKDFVKFIHTLIRLFSKSQGLKKYFTENDKVFLNFRLLALLQHYEYPTPLIDFTRNIYVALFFATDKTNNCKATNSINDYFSIYYFDRNNPEFVNYETVARNDLDRILSLLENEDIPVSVENCTNNILYASFEDYQDIGFLTIDSNKIWKPFEISNHRIDAQEGLFIIETDPYLSLDEIIRKRSETFKINCVNIHKSLSPYIKSILNEKGISNQSLRLDAKSIVEIENEIKKIEKRYKIDIKNGFKDAYVILQEFK